MIGLKTLVWGFSIISATVTALQTSTNQKTDPVFSGVHVFLSKNALWCAQAQADAAKDALTLYQSMPRGKLYKDIKMIDNGTTCADIGYTFSQAEDPCYPGLQNSFRNEKEKTQFLDSFESTLLDFGKYFSWELNDTRLMDACKCKDQSASINYWGKSCERVQKLLTLVKHRDLVKRTNRSKTKPIVMNTFVSKDKLWCGQAQADLAKDALDLYKSMPRGKLYEGTSVSNVGNCADLGYTFSQAEDPCYPGLVTAYRNNEDKTQFLNSFNVILRDFGQKHKLADDDSQLLDACRCKDGSAAVNFWGKACERTANFQLRAEAQSTQPTSTQPTSTEPSNVHTFISMDKRFCAQARPRLVEGALALFKAMPRGKMFADILIHTNDTQGCEERGYKRSAGEDSCYPGLQAFYRNDEEIEAFKNNLNHILSKFAERFSIKLEDAKLMDDCTCHVDSSALKSRGQYCASLDMQEASWVHRDPNTDKQLACAGGPFVLATRSLAVMKLSEELPLHKTDQIAPVSCGNFGFPNRYPVADTCFTGIHAWTATTDALHDPLNQETKRVLDKLLIGGFKNHTESLSLDKAGFGRDARCKCAPNSKIGKRAKNCESEVGARNHIRDWWKE